MATRAHAEVRIEYTPNDCDDPSLRIWTDAISAPALSRWGGNPYDKDTVEVLIREAFDKALKEFLHRFEHEAWRDY